MTEKNSYALILFHARFWREAAYLLLGLPLGLLWGIYAITMYSLGASLVIVWVGVPLLVFTHVSMRWIGASERGLANTMLDARIPAPPGRRPVRTDGRSGGGPRGALNSLASWGRDVFFDVHAWRVAVWTVGRLVLGPLGFSLALVAVLMPFSVVGAIIQAAVYRLGWADWYSVGSTDHVSSAISFWTLVGSPVMLLLVPAFAWSVRGIAVLHVVFGRWALGASTSDEVRVATERAELAEEQVRIDQELHDSIGHMITMNIIQAGAGAHVFDTDPEFAREALRNIEERGRAAMGELDRIIATIRGDQEEVRTPLAGVADLGRLIDESRAAGMTIDAQVDAQVDVPPVPAAVGRAAFTIVREALTNAARHAPGARVRVRVERDGDALALEVVNEASSAPPLKTAKGNRRGLSGIRDRAALLGGRSKVGAEAGEFAVRALLPLNASLSAEAPDPASPWASLRERVTP
jgi:signal transduction histidine kinase